ncbi:hypothetical protein GCM10009630_46100 [Kribbella jejuensis]
MVVVGSGLRCTQLRSGAGVAAGGGGLGSWLRVVAAGDADGSGLGCTRLRSGAGVAAGGGGLGSWLRVVAAGGGCGWWLRVVEWQWAQVHAAAVGGQVRMRAGGVAEWWRL